MPILLFVVYFINFQTYENKTGNETPTFNKGHAKIKSGKYEM